MPNPSKREQHAQQHALYFTIKQIMLIVMFSIILVLVGGVADQQQEEFHEMSSIFGCIDGLTEILDCIHGLFVFAFVVVPLSFATSFAASFLVSTLMTGVDNSQDNKSFWKKAVQALMPTLVALLVMLLFGSALLSDSVTAGTILTVLAMYLVPSYFIDRHFYFQYFNQIRVYKFELDKEIAPEKFQQMLGVKKIIQKGNNRWELQCSPKHDIRNDIIKFARANNVRLLALTGGLTEAEPDRL
jgi:hypothetical protein